ncbi:hypothetical protein HYV11_03715 [Candidatus Dependentiae bacterium]|nr:hypothetical protein [Candidatus Dependentiae bacterium]
MHNKKGYVLLIVFSILSLCMSLMSLFFSRSISYQHLMSYLVQKEKATSLALHSLEIVQSLFSPEPEKEDLKKLPAWKKDSEKMKPYYQTFLNVIFPYLNTTTKYNFTYSADEFDAEIKMDIFSESGKLNLNSLYDFKNKKFAYEGQAGDRKKFCEWLFERISKITNQPSLFSVFEQYLQKRKNDFNDVLELLSIKEFAHVFNDALFLKQEKKSLEKVYLMDIFTIATKQEAINPWFFSHSWQLILDLKSKKISIEEQEKLLDSFKNKTNWSTDWSSSLKMIYQKEYKDLPEEIKSLLTTECEANIFSLLLSATIGETTTTIFTIIKKQVTEKLIPFDVVKIYQL